MIISVDAHMRAFPFRGVVTRVEEIPPGQPFSFDTCLDPLIQEDIGYNDDEEINQLLKEYGIN